MVNAGMLGGLVLFTVLIAGSQAKDFFDPKDLSGVIDKLQKKYTPEKGKQFAIAFNAPSALCLDGIDNIINQNDPANVQDAYLQTLPVYKGKRLVAARPITTTNRQQHSEYLLMDYPNRRQSPMQNLMDGDETGCVVFYTYYSPCTQSCLNEKNTHCIIEPLRELKKGHTRVRCFVFVFTEIWTYDKDKDISKDFQKIMNQVLLYRCTANGCTRCTEKNLAKKCEP